MVGALPGHQRGLAEVCPLRRSRFGRTCWVSFSVGRTSDKHNTKLPSALTSSLLSNNLPKRFESQGPRHPLSSCRSNQFALRGRQTPRRGGMNVGEFTV